MTEVQRGAGNAGLEATGGSTRTAASLNSETSIHKTESLARTSTLLMPRHLVIDKRRSGIVRAEKKSEMPSKMALVYMAVVQPEGR